MRFRCWHGVRVKVSDCPSRTERDTVSHRLALPRSASTSSHSRASTWVEGKRALPHLVVLRETLDSRMWHNRSRGGARVGIDCSRVFAGTRFRGKCWLRPGAAPREVGKGTGLTGEALPKSSPIVTSRAAPVHLAKPRTEAEHR